MIVCRSFSRVDRLSKVASVPNRLSKVERLPCLNLNCYQNFYMSNIRKKMDKEKDGPNAADQYKTEKTAMPVWRRVSTQSSNYEVIEGVSITNVTKASEKTRSVLEEAVKSPNLDYSHFISLPLAIHPELVDKLNSFQNYILGNNNSSKNGDLESGSNEDSLDEEQDTTSAKNSASNQPSSSVLSDTGIDKSIFIKPETFHLTVLMLKLWNKDRVAAATEVLQRIDSKVKDALDNRSIYIKLKGLECMKGSPAKARVLYAPVEEIGGEGRLLRACQVIIEAFAEAGLVLEKDAGHTLKLHATLMNARHRKRKKRIRRYDDSFDARGIFKKYGSEEWGEYLIREVHLSQRFAFDERGYYHCCASIPFPESM